MKNLSQFTVLIERRALQSLLALLTLMAFVMALFGSRPVTASSSTGSAHKMAKDLQSGLSAPGTSKARWMRDIGGKRHVQVVIHSNDSDEEMTSLRAAIAAAGGSVHVRMPGLRMVTATLPASQVATLAQRSDVLSVTPNRATRRTASSLESITGALASNVRTGSTKTSYSGWDGSGIGIAVLDSGVMKAHEGFYNGSGTTRVKKNVQILGTTQSNWTAGNSTITSLQPGSSALASYDSAIAADSATTQDAFGHGTHVAAVAAGRAKYYNYSPDTTGIAPTPTSTTCACSTITASAR